jgi:hypothetical protein
MTAYRASRNFRETRTLGSWVNKGKKKGRTVMCKTCM